MGWHPDPSRIVSGPGGPDCRGNAERRGTCAGRSDRRYTGRQPVPISVCVSRPERRTVMPAATPEAVVRGQSVESLVGFKRVMMGSLTPPFDVNDWAARQVYIALGQFMACAALLGVDTCPMEGIDPAKYDETLGSAAQGYHTVVACA